MSTQNPIPAGGQKPLSDKSKQIDQAVATAQLAARIANDKALEAAQILKTLQEKLLLTIKNADDAKESAVAVQQLSIYMLEQAGIRLQTIESKAEDIQKLAYATAQATTISSVDVTQLPYGDTPSGYMSGTPGNWVLHLSLPAGEPGSIPGSLTKADVGLNYVDNTADLDKPISTAVASALLLKSPTSHNHDLVYAAIGHNHAALYDALGSASSAISTHVSAGDPHTQYALLSTLGTVAALASDTDVLLAANSDARIATQKAVKAYIAGQLSSFAPHTHRAMTILSPVLNDNVTLFYTSVAVTVSKFVSVISGSGSVVYTVLFAADRLASGTEVVVGGSSSSSLTTGDVITTFTNAIIPANSFVWVKLTAVTGAPSAFHMTMEY